VLLVANVSRLEDQLRPHQVDEVDIGYFAMQRMDAYRPEGHPILIKVRVRLILATVLGTVAFGLLTG
jgi:hypothetical protein